MNLLNRSVNLPIIRAGLLSISLLFFTTNAQSNDYCTDDPVDGAAYKVINSGSNLLLNVENSSTSNNANVNTLSNNGNAAQRFYLRYQSSSHYWKIEAAHTGMMINVSGGSTSNGGNITQVNTASSNSQEWELKKQSNGSYRIVNKNSSYSLTVAGSTEGSNVYQNQDAASSSQRWWLEPVSYTCGSSSSPSTASISLAGQANDSSVNLSWNGLSDISALHVYYDTDSNPSGRTRLAILNTSETSYTANNLQNGTAYWFWIKYLTADGAWNNSNAFSATPSGGSSSSSTPSVTLSGQAKSGAVDLSWNQVSDVSRLELYFDTDSNPGGRTKIGAFSTSLTSYSKTGLQNGTPYWFWVKFQTSDGVWHNSNALNATPMGSNPGDSNFVVTGYASTNGSTIGGAGGSTVTANSCSALKNYLQASDRLIIQIPDNTTIDCKTSGTQVNVCKIACPAYQDEGKHTHRIPTSDLSCSDLGAQSTTTKYRYDQTINVQSNKTLVGLGSNSAIEGASLSVKNKSNVIIRNLTLKNINPDLVEAGDGVGIENSDHVVVDHVKFSMISDGHVDVKNSDNVTLSYNEFDGYNPYVCANQHWYTNLVHESKATLHHNFWNYTAGRNPKLTGSNTTAHLYNNYWLEVTYFSIGADSEASALVEGNYFDDSARPHWNLGSGKIDGNVSTNIYTGLAASGNKATQDSGYNVTVPYAYSTESPYNMPDLVNETGPQ